jgi:hypothetical protein
MPKTTPQRVSDRRPARGPTKRALGLDPEITAQPRPFSADLGRETASEPGLSIDPDELGNRFLREATEQGDFDPTPVSELELSLMEDPTGADETPVGASFTYERSFWDESVDRQLETRGAADQLREPAPSPRDDFDEADDELRADDQDDEVQIAQSYIREVSLLDREGSEGDETEVPEIDTEDGGRHARSTPRGELGEQVENSAGRQAHTVTMLGRASRVAARLLHRVSVWFASR